MNFNGRKKVPLLGPRDYEQFFCLPGNNWIWWSLRTRLKTWIRYASRIFYFNLSSKRITSWVWNFNVLECVLIKHWLTDLKNSPFHFRALVYLGFNHNVIKICTANSSMPYYKVNTQFAVCPFPSLSIITGFTWIF